MIPLLSDWAHTDFLLSILKVRFGFEPLRFYNQPHFLSKLSKTPTLSFNLFILLINLVLPVQILNFNRISIINMTFRHYKMIFLLFYLPSNFKPNVFCHDIYPFYILLNKLYIHLFVHYNNISIILICILISTYLNLSIFTLFLILLHISFY